MDLSGCFIYVIGNIWKYIARENRNKLTNTVRDLNALLSKINVTRKQIISVDTKDLTRSSN